MRLNRRLSLASVAEQAGISVATLSRIETEKQGLGVDLLVTLAGILGTSPADVLGSSDDGENLSALSQRMARLGAPQRTQVFLESSRRRRDVPLETVLDDLLSAVDVLRDELIHVQRAAGQRRRR